MQPTQQHHPASSFNTRATTGPSILCPQLERNFVGVAPTTLVSVDDNLFRFAIAFLLSQLTSITLEHCIVFMKMAESSALREDSPAVASSCNDAANSSSTETTRETNCEKGRASTAGSEENAASVSGSEQDLAVSEQGEVVLHQLARQVEYYFSTANLSKDTYVATLRSLNDGYVPISILANFGKVRALVPYDGINAVYKAAMDHSNLIEVVMINTQTGKKVPVDEIKDDSKIKMLQAVGPISGEPIPVAELRSLQHTSSSPSTPTAPAVQNTVILREVPNDVKEENVRELFTFDSCPPIQSVRIDVANCW